WYYELAGEVLSRDTRIKKAPDKPVLQPVDKLFMCPGFNGGATWSERCRARPKRRDEAGPRTGCPRRPPEHRTCECGRYPPKTGAEALRPGQRNDRERRLKPGHIPETLCLKVELQSPALVNTMADPLLQEHLPGLGHHIQRAGDAHQLIRPG
ncbi:MAG: hypothetical protein PWP72_2121, partial [Thermoanaerobacter sp.]|nr:hypothetical protein [Thermoanaerobacter sp.]